MSKIEWTDKTINPITGNIKQGRNMAWQNDWWNYKISLEALTFIQAQTGDFVFCKKDAQSPATGIVMGDQPPFYFDENGEITGSDSQRGLLSTDFEVLGPKADYHGIRFATAAT